MAATTDEQLRERKGQTGNAGDRQTDRPMDKQTNRQTSNVGDRQTDRQTGNAGDRQHRRTGGSRLMMYLHGPDLFQRPQGGLTHAQGSHSKAALVVCLILISLLHMWLSFSFFLQQFNVLYFDPSLPVYSSSLTANFCSPHISCRNVFSSVISCFCHQLAFCYLLKRH